MIVYGPGRIVYGLALLRDGSVIQTPIMFVRVKP